MIEFFLGIDVSKGYADFIVLNKKRQIVEDDFQLDDTFDGHTRLCSFLNEFFQDNPTMMMYAGVESTGGYENNWYEAIHKLQSVYPIAITRLNPYYVNHHGKARKLRTTTDAVSAKTIADYLIAHQDQLSFEHEDYFSRLRRHWNFITLLTKQKTQLLNQLQSVLYSTYPEILQHCQSSIPQWVLTLLSRYPTAKHVYRAKCSSLVKIPYLTNSRAKELKDQAKQSVASSSDDVSATLVKEASRSILDLAKNINRLQSNINKDCMTPEVELLMTFPGIGTYSAIGLMIEIVAIERFKSAKKLASYFGVHPLYKASGDGLGCVRMSKQGRRQPRNILYTVAWVATQKNPHIMNIYVGLLQRGMKKMAAIGVIMHKILRIIYGMLKNKQVYLPEIDRQYRERMAQKKIPENAVSKTARRYQGHDVHAPISRRQNKKRKEQDASQNEHCHLARDLVPAHQGNMTFPSRDQAADPLLLEEMVSLSLKEGG